LSHSKYVSFSFDKKPHSTIIAGTFALSKRNGYDTVLTRNDKNDIADKSLDTIAKRKKSDMYKRLDIYNSSLKNVAISIHQNTPTAPGSSPP